MAADWIKIEVTTPHKQQVLNVASRLGIPRAHALGLLIELWCWFDQHTENGHAAVRFLSALDEHVGHPGFCEAVAAEEWLVEDDGVTLPHFDEHNGTTAKRRAQEQKRKKGKRAVRTARRHHADTKRGKSGPDLDLDLDVDKKPPTPFDFENPKMQKAADDWLAFRAELKKPLTKSMRRALVQKRDEWGDTRLIAAIRHTIFKGWQGLREPEGTDAPRRPRVETEAGPNYIDEAKAEAKESVRKRAERRAWFDGLTEDERLHLYEAVEGAMQNNGMLRIALESRERTDDFWVFNLWEAQQTEHGGE